MRNPITPSPSRPIPLPDCILRDGWWAVEAVRPERDSGGAVNEGRIERDHRRDDGKVIQMEQGR